MKRLIGKISLYILMIVATISFVTVALFIVKEYKEVRIYAKTNNNGFSIYEGDRWENIFVKGVNLGVAMPGKWATEMPEDEDIYLDWFNKIGEMNANCIRIYTLLPSQFYSALYRYNKENEKKLWLLQEIWPEEHPEGNDYLKEDYINDYLVEIEYVINAIHGNAVIYERRGRAYGVYNKDVSRYVLGYLVGRELEPDEVIETNLKNKGFSFRGEYVTCANEASPTEAWLAMNCDYVLEYEEKNYKTQHPVSIVSWPTLDVKEHDSEWNEEGVKSREYNDKTSVDINNINIGPKMMAGFFGAYHIYPNYPDFMNNESKYDEYYDEEGRLRYGGYLKEFMEGHTKYPALVAEFGLPTGMGNAHTSPDGLNHGGLTEDEQGDGVVRMMKAIKREGYAGGVIFAWMDEWSKKSWTTEPFMIPYDRHAYWHNAIDPEQNYGLLAMEAATTKEAYKKEGKGSIKSMSINHDAAFLYFDIELTYDFDFKKDGIVLGIDTYDRFRGDFWIDKDIGIRAKTGLEFVVNIHGKNESKILVQPGYNISNYNYASYTSSSGVFEEIIQLTARERITRDGKKIEAIYENESKLKFGEIEDNYYNHFNVKGNRIIVRIPWGRLNFTDPSTMTVLDDRTNPVEIKRDLLNTTETSGILVYAALYNIDDKVKVDLLELDEPYSWEIWDEEPEYKPRLKNSYYKIKDYFAQLGM